MDSQVGLMGKQSFQILANDGMHKKGIEELGRQGITVINKKLNPEELRRELSQFHGIVIRSATKLDRDTILAGYNNGDSLLRIIGRAGKGLDNVHIPTATECGILVKPAPEGNNNATAEFTIGLLFDVARRISYSSASAHEGKWVKKEFKGMELKGKTLGIIGCGQIGQEVASKAAALGMRVIGYDPYAKPSTTINYRPTIEAVLSEAHFVTIHTGGKVAIIGEDEIANMKNGAFLINASRGENVDAEAIKRALKEGKLSGFAMDVHLNEPKEGEKFVSPLQDTSATLTPHIAGSTGEADVAVSLEMARLVADYLIKGDSRGAVNVGTATSGAERETFTVAITHRDDAAVFKDFDALFGEAGVSIQEVRSVPMKDENRAVATTTYILYAEPSKEVISKIGALEFVSRVTY